MKKPRTVLLILGLCLLVVLLVAQVIGLNTPEPIDAARAKAVAEGYHDQNLSLAGFTRSGVIGQSAYVEFFLEGQKPPKIIRVDLHRPFWSTQWNATQCNERVMGLRNP
jgi:hypothetical protein